jgi:hypothetical protein
MMRAHRIERAAWAAAALITVGGCTTILGVNQDYHPVDNGGSGGDQATSSTASSTGTTSTTGTGGDSSSSAASSSGAGCMAPGASTCTPTCGCTAAQKCAVTDETLGTMTCIAAGLGAAWSRCDTNVDCDAATWCDHVRGVCKPFCELSTECPPGGHCIYATQSDGKTIVKGVGICSSHCNPLTAAPCGANATCMFDPTTQDFDCSTTLDLPEGAACTVADDCAKGLTCYGAPGALHCSTWCTPINDTKVNPACPADSPFCTGLAVPVVHDGTSYGICLAG